MGLLCPEILGLQDLTQYASRPTSTPMCKAEAHTRDGRCINPELLVKVADRALES
jgi:hypothetical protein